MSANRTGDVIGVYPFEVLRTSLAEATKAIRDADIEGVLGTQITGVRGLDLAPGLVVELLLLQRLNLSLGQDDALFRDLGFERLQAGLEVD